MPNDHIDINILKTISLSTGADISQNITAHRAVASSVETANKRLDLPFTLQILSNILHDTVSTAMAVLDASHPRGFRLAGRVSAWTIFVGVFPILMSLLMTEAVAQTAIAPGPPRDFKATVGDRKITLTWKPPSYTGSHGISRYRASLNTTGVTPSGGAAARSHTFSNINNGQTYDVKVEVIGNDNFGKSSFSETLKVTPKIPAPTNFRVTAGDGRVTLSWTAPSPLAVINGNTQALTDYEYSGDGGDWTSTSSTSTTHTVSGLENGIQYAFKVRAVRTGDPNNADPKGTASRTVTVTPLGPAPEEPISFDIEMVEDKDTNTAKAILTWSPLSNAKEDTLRYEYRYKFNPWTPWKSAGSSGTTTVTNLEIGKEYTFEMRAIYVGNDGSYISFPSNSSNSGPIVLERKKPPLFLQCPVGWMRSDGVARRTRRVLLYEVNLEMDLQNRRSIYKPVSVAIYVHPDERLETLDGWKLQVAIPYNHHREYLLTAENSVVVDSKVEGVAGGFAFIENPKETPFPMVGMGFTRSLVPGFDYRLYDDKGKRVDFGIACYKRSDIFQVLKVMEGPSVLRQVDLETLDWDAPYIRSKWTVPVPVNVPGAPSLQSVNLVGKWADLKKQ